MCDEPSLAKSLEGFLNITCAGLVLAGLLSSNTNLVSITVFRMMFITDQSGILFQLRLITVLRLSVYKRDQCQSC